MIRNDFEQIPDGMMDRISKRLAEHVSARKKRRKVKTVLIAVACTLLLPISAYAFINISNDNWGWFEGIKKAEKNGKTVEINKEFTYKDGKILFEDAVWEDDCLLLSYSVFKGTYIPYDICMYDDNGERIDCDEDYEFDGKRNGTIKVSIDKNKKKSNVANLSILTLKSSKPINIHNIEYEYELMIYKSLLTNGMAEINKEYNTSFGTLKLLNARYEDNEGRIIISYSFNLNENIKNLIKDSTELSKIVSLSMLYIKDRDNNIIKIANNRGNSDEDSGYAT